MESSLINFQSAVFPKAPCLAKDLVKSFDFLDTGVLQYPSFCSVGIMSSVSTLGAELKLYSTLTFIFLNITREGIFMISRNPEVQHRIIYKVDACVCSFLEAQSSQIAFAF